MGTLPSTIKEQNATGRFLLQFFKEHYHLSVVFTFDALSAKVPYLQPILEGGGHFIVGVNPTGNPSLFEWLKGVEVLLKIDSDPQATKKAFSR